MESRQFIGIPELDAVTGGVVAGRFYFITGPCGSGKMELSLRFLKEGLDRKERCLLIASEKPEDLLLTAETFGFDPTAHLESDRLVIYHPEDGYADMVTGNGDAHGIGDEIVRLAEGRSRVVVESFSALLQSRYPVTGNMGFVTTLLGRLDDMPATLLMADTDGEGDTVYPRSIVERYAFGVFAIRARESGRREVLVRKLRGTRLAGRVVSIDDAAPCESPNDSNSTDTRPVLHLARGESLDLQAILGNRFEVIPLRSSIDLFTRLIHHPPALVVLDLEHDDSEPFEICSRLKENGSTTPVLFIGPSRMRSLDRVRCFRVGADEVLGRDTHPDEIRFRVGKLPQKVHPDGGVDTSLTEGAFMEACADRGVGPIATVRTILTSGSTDALPSLSAGSMERFENLAGVLAETHIDAIGYLVRFTPVAAEKGNGAAERSAPAEAARVALECLRDDDLVVGVAGGELAAFLVGADEAGFEAFHRRLWEREKAHFGGEPPVRYRYGTARWSAGSTGSDVQPFLKTLVRSFAACPALGAGKPKTVSP